MTRVLRDTGFGTRWQMLRIGRAARQGRPAGPPGWSLRQCCHWC
ncbi:hypothetical protein [Streptomyces lydicus]